MTQVGGEFGGSHRPSGGQRLKHPGGDIAPYIGVHGVRSHPLPALPQDQVLEMVRTDKARLVGPVLHHAARVGARHSLEDGAVVVPQAGEERQVMAPRQHIDGVDLDEVEAGKSTAHRP
ncbi:hypothetical protein D9M72_360570 [compost metagenome]